VHDARPHRGPDPRDAKLFAPDQVPRLREALADYAWLLSRGYAAASALKLVGDRYALAARQRMAVLRCACSDEARAFRLAHRVNPDDLRGQPLWLDGFNVLTTIEAALGGAVVLVGREGAYRDLAGVHGTYRRVAETIPAVARIGDYLDTVSVGSCVWYLDRPVSNSGRLRAILLDLAAERGWSWSVELPFSPDPILADAPEVIATADAAILDRGPRWFPLARAVIEAGIPDARLVDFL
jgi:hypothetical protein